MIVNPSSIPPTFQLVEKKTFAGVNNVNFSTLGTHKTYFLVFEISIDAGVTDCTMKLEYNGDTTQTNYYWGGLIGAAASGQNNATIAWCYGTTISKISGQMQFNRIPGATGGVAAAGCIGSYTNTNGQTAVVTHNRIVNENITSVQILTATGGSGIANFSGKAALYYLQDLE